MKRILALSLLALIAMACMAQPTDVVKIYAADTPRTLAWDDVTMYSDGSPTLAGTIIAYRIYAKQWLSEGVTGEPILVADNIDVTGAQFDISAFPAGWYYMGVEAFDATDPTLPGLASGIAWSNDPVAVDPTQLFAWFVTGRSYLALPLNFVTIP